MSRENIEAVRLTKTGGEVVFKSEMENFRRTFTGKSPRERFLKITETRPTSRPQRSEDLCSNVCYASNYLNRSMGLSSLMVRIQIQEVPCILPPIKKAFTRSRSVERMENQKF
jgi:hypothetical protein